MTENWPGDSASVVRWMRAMLDFSEPGVEVTGLDRIRIAADLDGDDLTTLAVDATRVSLKVKPDPDSTAVAQPDDAVARESDGFENAAIETGGFAAGPPGEGGPGEGAPADGTAEKPQVVQRRRGIARSIRIIAAPLKVQRVPMTFDLRAADLPIEWVVYDRPEDARRPETIRSIEIVDDESGAHGALSFSMRVDDIARLIRRMAKPFAGSEGVHIGRVDLDLAQDGPDGIRASGRAGIRWKLLMASARAEARVGFTPDGVFTLRALEVHSWNPVIAIGLRVARKQIREAVGKSFDINADLPVGSPRMHDVRVQVDEELRLSARVGHG